MDAVKGSILVVDDDPINRMTLKASVEEQGFAVDAAETGLRALEMLRSESYDVVLLDLLMPEMDGFEVLKEVKKDPSLRHVPVIVISAVEEMDSVVRCIEMGATDYLCKPFDPILLRARLSSSLVSKQLHDMEARYLSETEELARQLKIRNKVIKRAFGRYLSDEIVTNLLDSPEGLELGGERRRVTILLADLRGFTAITERLQPEQVVRLLNNFLGTMADTIIEHKGTIDEFLGDAILCLFGAPTTRQNDAHRAVSCAVAMQNAMKRVNEVNRANDLPTVEMGIGVNTGDVVVGNIGSLRRTKYGAVGPNMNLTARIESVTVGGQILISDSTLAEIRDDAKVGDSFKIRAKGFVRPITVHELLGIGPSSALSMERRELDLSQLDRFVPVDFAEFEGKQIDRAHQEAKLVGISATGSELFTRVAVTPMRNIKLTLLDPTRRIVTAEVYGKVQAVQCDGTEFCSKIRFTSDPREADRFLSAVKARAASGDDP